MMKRFTLFLTGLFCLCILKSQNVAIGQWTSHLPYSGTVMVADAGDKVYAANTRSVFSYDKTDNSYTKLSTAAGFSDIGIKGINYNKANQTLVIAYTNSNLDFLFDNEIYNYPFIQSSNISGDKNIYSASFYGDTVILSCGFGLVLFDIEARESPATFFFTDTDEASIQVNQCTVFADSFFAATENGLYQGALSESNLQDFSKWNKTSGTNNLPEGAVRFVTVYNNMLFAQVADTLYQYNEGIWENYFYDTIWQTNDVRTVNNNLLITQVFGTNSPADSCRVIMVDGDGTLTEIVNDTEFNYLGQSDLDEEGNIWIADAFRGLIKYNNGTYNSYLPNGPFSDKVFDMKSINNELFVAPGEINASWNYAYNRDGFFTYSFGKWQAFNEFSYNLFDSVFDLLAVDVDITNNIVYFGSYGGGLIEFRRNTNEMVLYKQGYLQMVAGDTNSYRIGGLALDDANNLWMSNYGATDCIVVKKADGTWKSFNPEMPADIGNQVGAIAIDDFQTKWIQLPRGNGILVFNDNGTIDDESDDLVKVLGAGSGNGNLHVNYINAIAVDKQNEIWVGTSEGITIFYNPSEIFTGTAAGDATQPLVNLGGYYEQLLRNDIVNTIAVDGANRKWVGTNSGAFLISADGTEQLLYFNADNSPLISNTVLNIEIDPVTGDVYFGTDKGIIAYRSTATEGVAEINDVSVFPNPVRENYNGTIAINGLTPDADVNITDMAGRVIYKTTALGGQAVWDGKGYEGNRAATGVYLVYSSNEDGSQTYVAKILMISGK
ncbi:MAG: two-component regulator propeller domain-containing protein [Chitinophagales bacterium]